MRKFYSVFVLMLVWAVSVFGQNYPLKICSFNIQFLGQSKVRDDAALANLLKKYDVIVVQELVAPPYPGNFPDGEPFKPDPEAKHFFDQMKSQGFDYILSPEDTGTGAKIHLNTSATEWFVAFYKPQSINPAKDLPSGFLSPNRAHNQDFDRVPFAFAFRTVDSKMDFVLISVHLRPSAGLLNAKRRQHELATVASWVESHNQKEKDFVILGDMNIEGPYELASDTPPGFRSLNRQCRPTNTNVKGPKPYDHVLFLPNATREIDQAFGFEIVNLIEAMRPVWKSKTTQSYPGGPPYKHDVFRQIYTDHDPVVFELNPLPSGDDD